MPQQSHIKEFSAGFLSALKKQLLEAKNSLKGPVVAAFDADGTLWDTDMGERFFLYQIKNSKLPHLPPDPWKHYHELKAVDKVAAYYWLAQINSGQTLTQVRKWAADCVDAETIPIFQSQKNLIQFLKENNVEVYIVTASVKWAVEPAALHVGVDFDHVLGMHTEVTRDVVGKEPIPPATYRAGKLDAILKASGGVSPFFCSGNTPGDFELMKGATHLRLAVRTWSSQSSIEDNHLRQDEDALHKEAQALGWLTHAF